MTSWPGILIARIPNFVVVAASLIAIFFFVIFAGVLIHAYSKDRLIKVFGIEFDPGQEEFSSRIDSLERDLVASNIRAQEYKQNIIEYTNQLKSLREQLANLEDQRDNLAKEMDNIEREYQEKLFVLQFRYDTLSGLIETSDETNKADNPSHTTNPGENGDDFPKNLKNVRVVILYTDNKADLAVKIMNTLNRHGALFGLKYLNEPTESKDTTIVTYANDFYLPKATQVRDTLKEIAGKIAVQKNRYLSNMTLDGERVHLRIFVV